MSERLQLDAPYLGDLEKEHLCRAIDSGFVSTIGPFVPEFEERFASHLGAAKGVAVQSGTGALHMALHELRIGSGDEVIVPALTFVATVNPIVYVGATPVFADVDAETWTIDPQEIERSITPRTKAIIPVHLYGIPCKMDEIMRIAEAHGLFVIEDATESLGATFKGRPTGTFGDFGCFSFNGNKIITTGGGGMLVGRDTRALEHVRFLVNQARDESRGYYHPEIGFNYRMTNIEAALGLAQMERLPDLLAAKRMMRRTYMEELENRKGFRFQSTPVDAESSCWLTCLTVDGEASMEALQFALRERGVPTRRVFGTVAGFPPYKRFPRGTLHRTEAISARGLCLPSSACNAQQEIRQACSVLRDLLP